jgi:aspartate aminotransferase
MENARAFLTQGITESREQVSSIAMAAFLDSVPVSGIIKIRDMMYTVDKPFRLDQGDVSFDAPPSVKDAMLKAVHDNRTHYLPTTGVPRLLELLAEKLRTKNGVPVGGPGELMVTTGGIHAQYLACQALLEPGDEVLVPDPCWPPTASIVQSSHAVPVPYPLHADRGWRPDLAEIAAKITSRTKAIVICTPSNPTGGVLTRADLEGIAALAVEKNLWVLADEAYEDFQWDGEHVSIGSLPGMYERTIPLHTFSKTYAMTGLRLGYLAIKDKTIRSRAVKVLMYTASNISSIVQYAGIGALEGPQDYVADFRKQLFARRQLFHDGITAKAAGVLTSHLPAGAFYNFVQINPDWRSPLPGDHKSLSWAMPEYMIKAGRVGCIPGADFGANGEGYLRLCYARDAAELNAALESIGEILMASRK